MRTIAIKKCEKAAQRSTALQVKTEPSVNPSTPNVKIAATSIKNEPQSPSSSTSPSQPPKIETPPKLRRENGWLRESSLPLLTPEFSSAASPLFPSSAASTSKLPPTDQPKMVHKPNILRKASTANSNFDYDPIQTQLNYYSMEEKNAKIYELECQVEQLSGALAHSEQKNAKLAAQVKRMQTAVRDAEKKLQKETTRKRTFKSIDKMTDSGRRNRAKFIADEIGGCAGEVSDLEDFFRLVRKQILANRVRMNTLRLNDTSANGALPPPAAADDDAEAAGNGPTCTVHAEPMDFMDGPLDGSDLFVFSNDSNSPPPPLTPPNLTPPNLPFL